MRALIVSTFLLLASASATAAPPKVGYLSEQQCSNGDDDELAADANQDKVFLNRKTGTSQCVLLLMPAASETDTATATTSMARVLIDGQLLTLRHTSSKYGGGNPLARFPSLGEYANSRYQSGDGRIRITLKTRVTHSTCERNADTCCENTNKGSMIVERGGERTVLPVFH